MSERVNIMRRWTWIVASLLFALGLLALLISLLAGPHAESTARSWDSSGYRDVLERYRRLKSFNFDVMHKDGFFELGGSGRWEPGRLTFSYVGKYERYTVRHLAFDLEVIGKRWSLRGHDRLQGGAEGNRLTSAELDCLKSDGLVIERFDDEGFALFAQLINLPAERWALDAGKTLPDVSNWASALTPSDGWEFHVGESPSQIEALFRQRYYRDEQEEIMEKYVLSIDPAINLVARIDRWAPLHHEPQPSPFELQEWSRTEIVYRDVVWLPEDR